MSRRGRGTHRLELSLVLAAVLAWPDLSLAKVHRRGHAAAQATSTSASKAGKQSRKHKRHAGATPVASSQRTAIDSALALPEGTTSNELEPESAAAVPRRAGYQGTTNIGSHDAPIWKVTIDGR